jgi:tetrahydromethanopterin S-methyltransferase subunit F
MIDYINGWMDGRNTGDMGTGMAIGAVVAVLLVVLVIKVTKR